MDIRGFFAELIYILPAVAIALSVHEFAHAFVADKMGDPTARISGRMTMDPTSHVDILGFLALLFFGFGWAKPVPINPMNFKKRKLGMILVSLAGPLSNLILAIIFSILYKFVAPIFDILALYYILQYGVIINISLMIFNLIPVPPLDGSKILASLLPYKYEAKFYEYERYLYIILIVLLVTGVIGFILSPLMMPFLNILL